MNDLFDFLKNLIQNEPEVIAAFAMGVVIAVLFLTYPIYKLAAWFHSGKINALEADLKKANDDLKETQQERDDAKKKAKDRKDKLDEKKTEIGKLNAEIDAAAKSESKTTQRFEELEKQYDELVPKYNKLGKVATYWKKQAADLDAQAKLAEKLQGQL